MRKFKEESGKRKIRIKDELQRIKKLRTTIKVKMTVGHLKAMKGFEHLSDEIAERVIKQLEEYTMIVLGQINRSNGLK